ncbi:unnamed protein product [Closterium sp. NIES-53]
MKPAAPDARETVAPVAREPVAPVAREPVAPVARESVAPAARLAAEPVTPVAHVPVAPVASVSVSPVARVPVAPLALPFLTEFGGGAESLKLVGYVDAADAGDKQNRTSTGGYVFVFGVAAVSWTSQRIKCATLSSTESEYVAATEAGKEGRRLRFLLAEFRQLDAGTPTVLRVDNKLAIIVAEGMGLMGNLKHMERQQAWLQHMVKRGKFSLRYIPAAPMQSARCA